MYFSKLMAEGEEVELLSHGPFTISAACGTIEGEPRVSDKPPPLLMMQFVVCMRSIHARVHTLHVYIRLHVQSFCIDRSFVVFISLVLMGRRK